MLRGDVAALLDLQAEVAAAVDDERRHADGRQHVAHVDLGVHLRQRHGRAGARAHAQVGRPPIAELPGRSRRARRALLDADRAAPVALHQLEEALALLRRRRPRVVVRPGCAWRRCRS